jgi:hypothetical protein
MSVAKYKEVAHYRKRRIFTETSDIADQNLYFWPVITPIMNSQENVVLYNSHSP